MGSPEAIAYALGRAIERSEPRVKDVRVDILRDDPSSGTLELRIWITPIESNVPLNRTYPFYRKS
jgi:predicted component of type VI protein secretion system